MLTEELIKRYKSMTDAEKIAEQKKIIRYGDMSPLNLLFAMMLVLEPDHVDELLLRLKRDHNNKS